MRGERVARATSLPAMIEPASHDRGLRTRNRFPWRGGSARGADRRLDPEDPVHVRCRGRLRLIPPAVQAVRRLLQPASELALHVAVGDAGRRPGPALVPFPEEQPAFHSHLSRAAMHARPDTPLMSDRHEHGPRAVTTRERTLSRPGLPVRTSGGFRRPPLHFPGRAASSRPGQAAVLA